MNLKLNVNYLIKHNNDSYTNAGRCMGISPNTLWLIGTKEGYDPRISNLVQIAEYFDVSLDDLVYKDLSKERK